MADNRFLSIDSAPVVSESARRASAVELAADSDLTLRRTPTVRDEIEEADLLEDMLSLTKTASAISGHFEEHLRVTRTRSRDPADLNNGPSASEQEARISAALARPTKMRLGPTDVIHEVPSEFLTPYATRPSSPVSDRQSPIEALDIEDHSAVGYPDVGTIKSWRGICVLSVTCGAQMLDNVFMTGVNISLPAIQKEFDINGAELQWLISAYTLTFGGFLLLAGVMSDRYGRKHIFCAGMITLSIWSIANGFATSFIQMAIFRALQGVGAAMTVPSGVGIISSFFIAQDRTKALTYFGAAGAVGFCLGLILGGFITASLGWRYLFYLTVIVTGILGILGLVILPKDRKEGQARPRLDILGAGLSTGGLILLSFVLSSGGEYGWNKAFIVVLLIVSIALLFIFTWVEKKAPNPIMPLSLWKVPNFAAIWITGFMVYGGYQTVIYYITLISQDVVHLSAGDTAIRLLPMGFVGGTVAISMGSIMDRLNPKWLLLTGLLCCTIAPIPTALMEPDNIDFWKHVFPTSVIVVCGISIAYCTITVVLLSSVPVSAKSLCGGMVNTAFQLGSGVGLALATAIVQATQVNKGHGALAQYTTGMWCCMGLAGLGLVSSAFGVRSVKSAHGMAGAVH